MKSLSGRVVCILDIEKAYNYVKWNFLLSVLERKGFGQGWIYCIRFCISMERFSMLVNESPTFFFQSFGAWNKVIPSRRIFLSCWWRLKATFFLRQRKEVSSQILRWQDMWRGYGDYSCTFCWWHVCFYEASTKQITYFRWSLF